MLTITCDCGGAIRLLTRDEAAEYLGLASETVRYHVYEENINPLRAPAGIMLFDTRELDRFQANKRPVGRPPRNAE